MPFRYISRRAQVIRSFYSGIGKTAVIYPATFLTAVAVGCLILGIVFFLQDKFQASETQIGICAACFSVSYITGCLVLRPLSAHILPRYLLTISTLVMAVLVFCMIRAPSIALAIACHCLVGLAMAHFWPPIMGWLSGDLAGGDLSKVMSRFNICWSIGGIVSPALAGWLSEMGPAVPLYVVMGLMLLVSAMVGGAALALPSVRDEPAPSANDHAADEGANGGSPLRFSGWIGVFAAYMGMGLTGYIFPAAAREELGFGKGLIGVLLLVRAVFLAVTFAFMGRTTFWHNRGGQMAAGTLGLGVFLLLMPACDRPLLVALAFALLGVFAAQGYFNSLFHGLEGSANRAGRSALHEALLNVGIMTGAFLGGVLSDNVSTNAAYRVLAGIMGAIAVTQVVLVLRFSGRHAETCDSKRELS